MAKQKSGSAEVAEPVYTPVTIVKTDEIEGHVYRRGERHNVDAATLAAMRDKGMIDDGAAG